MVSGAGVTDASGRAYPGINRAITASRWPRRARYPLQLRAARRLYRALDADREALAALRRPDGLAVHHQRRQFRRHRSTLSTPDPFYADIPLDRAANATLLLTKTASVREASPGDFIQYRLQLTNRDAIPATRAARLRHPAARAALRARLDARRGASRPSRATAAASTSPLPTLAAGAIADVRYVVSVAPGAPTGEALNRAQVHRRRRDVSNEAAASVRLRPLLFTDAMTIIGRVTRGRLRRSGAPSARAWPASACCWRTARSSSPTATGCTISRAFAPGRHVVQLDTASIPATHEPVACDADTRQAGSAISRFVEGDGGLLKRVDFQLRPTGKAAVPAR